MNPESRCINLDPISHSLWFYFIARGLGLRKKWLGMLLAFWADIFMVLAYVFKVSWLYPLHFGIHSFLCFIAFIPLLAVDRDYFVSSVAGVYSHIALDSFTHHNFPVLFYPLSNFSLPFYLIYSIDPALILLNMVVLLPLLLIFESKSIVRYVKTIIPRFRISASTLLICAAGILTCFSFVYLYALVRAFPWFFPAMLVLAVPVSLMLGVLFLRELVADHGIWKLIEKHGRLERLGKQRV